MRKNNAQMEIMGLAIIVILITIAVFFTFTFLFRSDVDVSNEVLPKEVGRGFINTILSVNLPGCQDNTYEEVLRACAVGGSLSCDPGKAPSLQGADLPAGKTSCATSQDPCCFLQLATKKAADEVFSTTKRKYSFTLKGYSSTQPVISQNFQDIFLLTHNPCPGERDRITQPYTIATVGTPHKLTLYLDLCKG